MGLGFRASGLGFRVEGRQGNTNTYLVPISFFLAH